MKTHIVFVVMIMVSLATVYAETDKGNVLKTDAGNCVGKNTTFRERHWVDLDNDGKADYTVTVRLRRENGDEFEREIHMFVNQIGQMTIPCQLRSGETVYGFRLDRPNRGGHESIEK